MWWKTTKDDPRWVVVLRNGGVSLLHVAVLLVLLLVLRLAFLHPAFLHPAMLHVVALVPLAERFRAPLDRIAPQLTWSLTPHPPAGNVPVFRTASASLHPTPRVGATGGQDLLLSRTMLTMSPLMGSSAGPCLTWVVSPATGIDLQPQT